MPLQMSYQHEYIVGLEQNYQMSSLLSVVTPSTTETSIHCYLCEIYDRRHDSLLSFRQPLFIKTFIEIRDTRTILCSVTIPYILNIKYIINNFTNIVSHIPFSWGWANEMHSVLFNINSPAWWIIIYHIDYINSYSKSITSKQDRYMKYGEMPDAGPIWSRKRGQLFIHQSIQCPITLYRLNDNGHNLYIVN